MDYPLIDPVIVRIGPLQLRWYGLMYIVGFLVAYFLILHVCRKKKLPMNGTDVEDLITYSIVGLVLGARIGYCLIYHPSYYLAHPAKFFAVWEGGMSFHGGLVGLLASGWLFSRLKQKPFLMLADLGAMAATPGLFFGRIGNFINGELYGRVTDVRWGMVFPGGGPFPRHPSQLYEAVGEGLLLFLVLYPVMQRTKKHGVTFGVFLICYGVIRFILEFFREPDPQLGFVVGWLTMGQVLCVLMGAAGIILVGLRSRSQAP